MTVLHSKAVMYAPCSCRHRTVRVDHELLGSPLVKVGVPLRSFVQRDHRDIAPFVEVDFVVQDGVHQLPVVFHDRALARAKAERLGPAKTNPGRDVAGLRSLIDRTWVASDVEPRDPNRATSLGDLHAVVQHLGWLLHLVTGATATACLESDSVDGTVDDWLADDAGNLVWHRRVEGDINGLAAKRGSLGEALLVQVADNDNRSAEELGSRGGSKTDWTRTGNVHRFARLDAGLDTTVVSSREDIREQSQGLDLLHRLVAVWEFEEVPVRVRHHDILSLATDPTAHVDVAVCGTGARRVDIKADTGVSGFAELAPPARDVKRHGAEVSLPDELNVVTALDHLASDFVPKDHTSGRSCSASHHVLVRAADVGGCHLEDDTVVTLAEARVELSRGELELREVDVLNFDLVRPHEDDTAI
eukprot:m.431269 g.431269  ORF g.431269 m.431269 type:complete len:417 (-) comp17276_c0_seq1:1024-2274(-)